MFNSILEIFSVPIMILNFAGGIVWGIWLAFLGEWKLIGIGIFLLLSFHWIPSILMVPEIPIAGIAAHFYEKKNPYSKINAIICASIFYLNPSFESDKFYQRDLK